MYAVRRLLYGVLVLSFLFSASAVNPVEANTTDLARKATIRRDTYGVPHILAETEEAAALAHGYAAAEDHLGIMARLFLRARGQQAAYLGEQGVVGDTNILELGIYRIAKERFSTLPPMIQRTLNAYAEGYNLYLSKNRDRAPEWAFQINGIDVFAHSRAVLILEFAYVVPDWISRDAAEAARTAQSPASNLWVVGREKSASKRGMMLANPHTAWRPSQTFYEVHITVPGKLNISGAAIIGSPVILMGFNDHLGWTHSYSPVSIDAYELTIDPTDPNRYIYDGQPIPFKVEEIKINVKTTSGIVVRTKQALRSHHGPVVYRKGDKAYAVKSTALDAVDFITQWNLMAKAKSLAEFRAALSMQALPVLNIGYADREGNIYYLHNGHFGSRPNVTLPATGDYAWGKKVPGDTSATEWHAIHPIAELPQILNPAKGYLLNCNDGPWYATAPRALDPKNYPSYIAENGLGFRAQFTINMFESRKKITLTDLINMRFNDHLMLAERVKDDLIRAASRRQSEHELIAEAIQVLKTWQNEISATSAGSVLFLRWWVYYVRSIEAISKGKPVYYEVPWSESEPITTPRGIANPDLAFKALVRAASDLKKDFGTISVVFGDVHRLQRGAVDLPAAGTANSTGSLRGMVYTRGRSGKLTPFVGDSYLLAVEFTDSPTAYSVMVYSESSELDSKHFSDQTELYARKQMKRAWFSEEDILKNLERSYKPGE